MTEPTHDEIEPMLWLVHDDFMDWLGEAREKTISVDQKLDRIMLGLATLAKALAGGYRAGGLRQ